MNEKWEDYHSCEKEVNDSGHTFSTSSAYYVKNIDGRIVSYDVVLIKLDGADGRILHYGGHLETVLML